MAADLGEPRHTVSVITITRDDSAGLRATTASVLAQEGEFEIEHIVVDGGADPQTATLLADLGSTARLISEPDAGRYDAMNKGIRAATGDLLWFMHSADVFASPQAIGHALDSMTDVRRQWGYGYLRMTDGDRIIGVSAPMIPYNLPAQALGIEVLPHQAAYFGADLVAEIGEYDLNLPIAADQLFMMAAAVRCEPCRAFEFLCDFDPHGVGSNRPIYQHYLDLRIARRAAGVSVTGSPRLDTVLTWYQIVADSARKAGHDVIRRLRSRDRS